ncbi:glycosyltransferase family 2 protein [Methanosarcina sp.]|uniref:glycosyltransferase n=1 Tax=Methanosarcina sp. TaxID=2213 RepID=UPI00298832B1|nr:glycosyltransferase family 2 protein [Methanosarcina sp.]MDW5549189.1 glycosyltransferase family 2 protein [Methanosarcina sp.]MDW5553105.1 glycosyltransferase family 2 protein [Methanosarcina sp.]MDW5559369.1 glycosyltransferase family 2 protein [Methanosarcina sp.]
MEKVSIIIPTRNRSSFLQRSVSHAFAQDYENKEVIVSNNASTDNTMKILEDLKMRFSELQVVNQDYLLDLNTHWDNVIRQSSKGNYILLIPDDDVIIDESYITNAIRLFKQYNSIGLVFANYYIVNSSLIRINEINAEFEEFTKKEFLFANYNKKLFGIQGIGIPHLTAIFSRKAYDDTGGFDFKCLSPDTYLWLKILITYDVGFIREKVAEYLVHETNLSRTSTIEQKYSDTLIPKKIREYMDKIGANEPYIFETLNRMERIFYRRFHNALINDILSGELDTHMIKKVKCDYLLEKVFSRGNKDD